MNKGKVYLAGAGCGDYDLITLRAMNLIKECQVVVYDSLTDKRLVEYADENAEKICVGKRAGKPSESQEKINDIIVSKALEGKSVLRLKGGDPFVFGRGGEEALALENAQIEYELIPGVTSAVAVPELAGIPVTHRGVARSFHVITGHTREDLLPDDMALYAKLEGTLVFLMGLNKLENITESLIANGKSAETPAAVVSNGAYALQQKVCGTLGDICEKVKQHNVQPPAIIVVGDVCGLQLRPGIEKQLSGVTVTVTGTPKLSDKLSAVLGEAGAGVSRLDYLHIKEYEDNPALDDALKNLGRYTWIALTSLNGVDIMMSRLRRLRMDIRSLAGIRFAVIGSGTAKALEKYGIYAQLMPEDYTSEALGDLLARQLGQDDRLLIMRAEKGSQLLTEKLDQAAVHYDDIKTYDVVYDKDAADVRVETDYITFASASGAEAFFESGFTLAPHTRVVCIGDVTAKAFKKYKSDELVLSPEKDVEGIKQAIINDHKEK